MKITVNGHRYDLSTMLSIDGVKTRENHGVSVEAVYFGRISKRLIVETYSIWASGRNDGTVTGTCYNVIDPGDDSWPDSMQHWIDETRNDEHERILRDALDAHVTALTD